MQVMEGPDARDLDALAADPAPRSAGTRRGITFEQLAFAALFVMLFARAGQAPAQNDTWWHLRAGRDIWHGVLPTVERWSFTERGHAWPDHEWLSKAIFYALHRVGGMPLLALLVAVAVTTTFASVWRLMVGPVLRRGALVFLTLPATLIVASLRPQAFSLLLLVVTVTLLARQRFGWLPVVFLLWANLHGAVVIGGLVAAAALVTALVWERRYARGLAVCVAVRAVAVFLTPLGTGILGLVVGMSNEADISEWEPAWRNLPAGAIFGVIVVLTAAAVVALRRHRPLAWSDRVLDSRVDPYPDRLLRDHIRNEATADYRATFARYDIRCALLPPFSPTAHRLLHDGWRATYTDGTWLVLQPAPSR